MHGFGVNNPRCAPFDSFAIGSSSADLRTAHFVVADNDPSTSSWVATPVM